MKTLLRTVLLLLFCAPLSSFATSQVFDDIPIHTNNPPGDHPHAPAVAPLSCYYSGSMNELFIVSSTITDTVSVYIENTTSGSIITDNVSLSSIPYSIMLSGAGVYTIQITLPSGVVFYGDFSLE